MTDAAPLLTKAQGEKMNALHVAHVNAAQADALHRGMTCDLPRESPEARAAEQEARTLGHKTHKARTAYYAYVNQLTGGQTGT
ncbi:hypothetical protein [Nesterenkonia rhizosphaerae]|uniref:Integrase n=1 Tax=Nesterenkonia rhizosphaerae TaxID=1348272 RepID=A0ABP9FTV4_9MICC